MPGETRPQHPLRQREVALFMNKFSASLIAQTPHVPSAVRVRWTQVDLALFGVLAGKPHLHDPAVVHLRQEHPAWAATMTEADWAAMWKALRVITAAAQVARRRRRIGSDRSAK